MQTKGGIGLSRKAKSSSEDMPLISIITVVMNGDNFIERTIHSVINQKYKNIEYIIIDGASTDETLNIIRKYDESIDYWLSEKDRGIYDAMNKGIKLANGRIIGLINAGDIYQQEAISIVANKYLEAKRSGSTDNYVFYGSMKIIDVSMNQLIMGNNHFDSVYSRMFINHPSVFVTKGVYDQRLYDINFKIVADFDFFLSLYLEQKIMSVSFIPIDNILSEMMAGGISDRVFHYPRIIFEKVMIRRKNKCPILINLFYFLRDFFLDFPRQMLKDVLIFLGVKNISLYKHVFFRKIKNLCYREKGHVE